MKIKVKKIHTDKEIGTIEKGDWIDLSTRESHFMTGPKYDRKINGVAFSSALIPLGLAMKLPKYFEANIVPRSSTYSKYGIIQSNSMGIIDSSYCGNEDEWKFPAIAIESMLIPKNTRIAQFRIRPNQFAPWWIKLKWLFTSKIEFVYVDDLESENRGGFGSTGSN